MVRVRARCSVEVVSGVSGKFGDPYSTKSSPIFCFRRKSRAKRRLADFSFEGLVLLAHRARFLG